MALQNRVTPFGEIIAVPERGTMMGNRGILHDATGQIRRRWASQLWICCALEWQDRRGPVMAPGHYTRLFFLDEPTALAAGHRPCAYCRRAEYRAFVAAWSVGNSHLGLGERPRAVEIDRVLHEERLGPDRQKRLHPVNLEDLPDGVFVVGPPSPPWPTMGPLRCAVSPRSPLPHEHGAPQLRRSPRQGERGDPRNPSRLPLVPKDGKSQPGPPSPDAGETVTRGGPKGGAPCSWMPRGPACVQAGRGGQEGFLKARLRRVRALLLWRGNLWRWSPGGYERAGPILPGLALALTPPSIVRMLEAGYTPRPPHQSVLSESGSST